MALIPLWNPPSQTTMTEEGIARQRRLAEALMLGGSDTSPVQHWTQGAARLAQALAGRNQFTSAEAMAAKLKREADLKEATERAQAEQAARAKQMQPDWQMAGENGYWDANSYSNPAGPANMKPFPFAKKPRTFQASDYTRGAPQGMKWVDPSDASKGFEEVPGYTAKIPSDVAGKVALMKIAQKGIKDTRAIFERNWGAQDVVSSTAANVPGWLGGDVPMVSGQIGIAKRNVRMGVEAALRVMTGAAAPETEVERYAAMFMPGAMDTKESAKQKLDALENFMTVANEVVQRGRGGQVPLEEVSGYLGGVADAGSAPALDGPALTPDDGGLQPGAIVDGDDGQYEFNGGNPNDPNSWTKLQ